MLWWLAAAAAPLILHLWNRRRYRETPWAAMEYLMAALRKNSRRMQFENWLLLAVRMLIVMAVVAALAQPFLERAALGFIAGEPVHHVIVVDGSYSMGYRATDRNRFERARQLATQIVNESHQGDCFTLILMGEPPVVVVGRPVFDPGDFIDELDNLEMRHGGADLAATLAKVDEIITSAEAEQRSLSRHEVYFLTDVGQTTWRAYGTTGRKERVRDQAEKIAARAGLVIFDLGQSQADNVAVTSLRPSTPFTTIGRDIAFEISLRNFGRQPRSALVVELLVDDRAVAETTVDVEPSARQTVAFNYRFDRGGDHVVEARLRDDLLDVDNHRYLALPVRDQIRVLCVDGRPTGTAFEGATDYLQYALAPESDASDSALIRPEVISESSLVETDLSQFDAVFLSNVGQFTADEVSILDTYLQHGGGLIVFLGDQVQTQSYNMQLAGDADETRRVLPARLGSLVSGTLQRVDPLDYLHPIVSVFRGQERAGLLSTQIHTYIRLEPSEDGAAEVAVALENGDPLIVTEAIGRGRSILVASSADDRWNYMTTWPSFVPLVQEMLALAVQGRIDDRTVTVGEVLGGAIRTPATNLEVSLTPPPRRLGASTEVLSRPESQRVSPLHSQGNYANWSFAETYYSGIYHLHVGPPAERDAWYGVNVDPLEGDLTKLDPAELRDDVLLGVDFVYRTDFQSDDELAEIEATTRGALHRSLLYLVLGLLFTESVMAWRFGHHS